MINAGEVGPDVTLLINDSGNIVLCGPGGEVEVASAALVKTLARVEPVRALVARSETPISGMSDPIRRSLDKFGCTLEETGQ